MPSNVGRLIFLGLLATTLAAETIQRDKKAFALFNVVQFKNDVCQSSSSLLGGSRNGTCYTSSECTSKSGTASGNCAAGFGVCCVFLQTGTSPTISENRTYLRNPSFPAVYSETSSITYTINKCSSDICQFRLDFESFTTLGPTSSLEATGGACVDTFTTVLSSSFAVPVICGKNTGQHMYLHVGNEASNNAKITMAFTGASTARTWEIKVTQIPCTASYRAPSGCLQYHDELSGRFTTFNFLESTTKAHLASQEYNICLRQAEGYCCVDYIPCRSGVDSFQIDGLSAAANGAYDSGCTNDYVQIISSSTVPFDGALYQHSKYCGGNFGLSGYAASTNVFDCSGPFTVGIITNAAADAANPGGRGVCLEYSQLSC